MPKFRDTLIEDEKTLANSGTQTIELALDDPISEIHIKVEAKNGGNRGVTPLGGNDDSPIARCISKIELVDGSNVIYGLDGMLAQAMSFYQRGSLPSMQRRSGPTENQVDHFVLRFGRFLYDQAYALVPNKFRNLQLKITWDLAKVNSIGNDGFLTDTGKLTIMARIMEEMASEPVGYMMAKEHFDWTTAASGIESIVLPTDYPYVLMLLRSWNADEKITKAVTNLKLSIDQDKDIPFDLSAENLLQLMENEFGKITMDQQPYITDGTTFQTWIGSAENGLVTPSTIENAPTDPVAQLSIRSIDSGHATIEALTPAGAAYSGEVDIHARITGQALNHCFAYLLGRKEDPDSWLNAPDFGSMKLKVTQGQASADAKLALLQARPY